MYYLKRFYKAFTKSFEVLQRSVKISSFSLFVRDQDEKDSFHRISQNLAMGHYC